MQTIERHLMRSIEDIVKENLDIKEMEELVQEDEDIEARKKDIRCELDMIEKALVILRPYLRI
jgi:hypothetical protein